MLYPAADTRAPRAKEAAQCARTDVPETVTLEGSFKSAKAYPKRDRYQIAFPFFLYPFLLRKKICFKQTNIALHRKIIKFSIIDKCNLS